MNPVVHFEMSYDDSARASRFYEAVFGWKTQQYGEEMGNYVLAFTTPTGEDGRPHSPGAINGGFYARSGADVGPEPSVVIAVDDINDAVKRVNASGGATIGEVMEIPGIGQYAAFRDPEGNRVGMLQPVPM